MVKKERVKKRGKRIRKKNKEEKREKREKEGLAVKVKMKNREKRKN